MFGEKNLFVYFNNLKSINLQKDILQEKNLEKERLTNYFNNFQNHTEFREQIVREKLFFKRDGEKILRYEITSE